MLDEVDHEDGEAAAATAATATIIKGNLTVLLFKDAQVFLDLILSLPVSKAMRRAVVFRTPRLFVCGDVNR